MPWIAQAEVTIAWVPAGAGGAAMGQAQANVPGQGQTLQPHSIGNAQSRKYIVAEAIPVSAGANPTLANINTALTSVVSDLAASSGTPIITAAELAIIDGWSTGLP